MAKKGMLSYREFLAAATEGIERCLGGREVREAIVRDDVEEIEIPVIAVANSGSQPYIFPSVQAYIDYSDMYEGDIEMFCRETSAIVNAYDAFWTHADKAEMLGEKEGQEK